MPAVLFNRPDQIQPKSERNFVQFILSSLLMLFRDSGSPEINLLLFLLESASQIKK